MIMLCRVASDFFEMKLKDQGRGSMLGNMAHASVDGGVRKELDRRFHT